MDYIYEMPAQMLGECDKKGKVELFTYNTETYDDMHCSLSKRAYVYLPWDYDAGKKYNVLYLLHGGGEDEKWWFIKFPETVTILDNMFAQELCRDVIVVTPSFYHLNGDQKDRDAEYITENFAHELRWDLIPEIESRYSTWCEGDVSEKNLIATRDHRAFAGLSLGSMTTYRAAIYNNFDIFSWFGPFSGCCGPVGNREHEIERLRDTLADGEARGLKLKYMLCCNGDHDIAYEEHKYIMDKAPKFASQLRKGENYDFFTIPGGIHDMAAWQLHLYHALQLFFTF